MVLGAINYLDILKEGTLVELLVMGILLIASIYSWAIILGKWTQLKAAKDESATFLTTFWKASRLENIYTAAQQLPKSPLSNVFRAGYDEMSRVKETHTNPADTMSERLGGIENVQRALARASSTELTQLESRLSFLGTVGAAAPFVGLFGTVLGILNAFNEISEKGNATLSTVAAPVGNALFATAAGLFAAIPAVVAYNAFVSRVRIFDSEMANFSSDFLNIIKRHFFK